MKLPAASYRVSTRFIKLRFVISGYAEKDMKSTPGRVGSEPRGSALNLVSYPCPPFRDPAGGRYLVAYENIHRPVRRIEARRAGIRPDGSWELHRGEERILTNPPSVAPFETRTYRFPETIAGFLDGETPPEEMTYSQLSGYVEELRRKGYEARRHETDLEAKIAYPLLNVLIAMLAIPFALRGPRAGGLWRSIGLGLLVGFACWIVLSASLSLGKKGIFPPLLAAWLPGALFVGTGAALFRSVGR